MPEETIKSLQKRVKDLETEVSKKEDIITTLKKAQSGPPAVPVVPAQKKRGLTVWDSED